MKKDLLVLLNLSLITSLIYFKAFSVFFVQDDFILINQFSQNSLLVDLKNVFGYPTVTHWRPLHNLYFFITGTIFGKNYSGYHTFTFFLHIISVFFVYKLSFKLIRQKRAAFLGSLIYAISPVHFVSLSWISGNATLIAFLFYIISLYLYMERRKFALIFYFLSILASEAFFFASITFLSWDYLSEQRQSRRSLVFILMAFAFFIVKILFFTPKITFAVYKLEFSPNTLESVKYYLLRVAGFGETSGDFFPSFILLGFLAITFFLIFRQVRSKKNLRLYLFFLMTIIAGLFPFILIPSHLSPHYMNISAFGFSMIAALALYKEKPIVTLILAGLFLLSSFLTVNIARNKNWVIERSNISKYYIQEIERVSPPKGSHLIFNDNNFSTSKEAYISLGTGQALKFWFKDKNYSSCYNFYEVCGASFNSFEIN